MPIACPVSPRRLFSSPDNGNPHRASKPMRLLGKTALVTGAARGIGWGAALELARAGADVAINDRERTAQAEAAVAEIQALGRQAVLIEGDIFTRPGCEQVVSRAVAAFGRL